MSAEVPTHTPGEAPVAAPADAPTGERRGFGAGRGRPAGGRGGPPRGGKKDEEEWIPVTKLGRLVQAGKINTLEEIYLFSIPIKEE